VARRAVVTPCPVCGGSDCALRFAAPTAGSEGGVSAEAFRPSAADYGRATGRILRCRACGHGFVAEAPPAERIAGAYAEAADPVSLREEAGQVATAHRDLAAIERHVAPGRLLDVGCWTGSFLVAARERDWDGLGVEPSRWAAERARARGVEVRVGTLEDARLPEGAFRLVVMADVLEHLADPAAAVRTARRALEPGGALFVAGPDAGSALARLLGRHWWSVLPMHLQHFTRGSMRLLLERNGFRVVRVTTHPKVFTARYYAERLAGYAPAVARLAVTALERARLADRPVAPDTRDRMAVLALRREGA
jgi:SAM-dependent methyltransferase